MVKHCPFCGTEPKFKAAEDGNVTITLAFEGDLWHSGHQKDGELLNVRLVCPTCVGIETRVHYRLVDAIEDWNNRVNSELDLATLVLRATRLRLASLIPSKVEDYMLVQQVLADIDRTLEVIK